MSAEMKASKCAAERYLFPEARKFETTDHPVLRRKANQLAELLSEISSRLCQTQCHVDYDPDASSHEPVLVDGNTRFVRIFLPGWQGTIIFGSHHHMIRFLAESFYGGTGERPNAGRHRGQLTPSELRLAVRLDNSMASAVERLWQPAVTGQARILSTGTHEEICDSAKDGPIVFWQNFALNTKGKQTWPIALGFSAEAFAAATAETGNQPAVETAESDPVWQSRLSRALAQVQLPVRAVLARPVLSLPQLAGLQVGDVLPVAVKSQINILVADRQWARGTMGEREGSAALRIESFTIEEQL
jgi:flagellar motor switch protein FliM